MSKPTLDPSTWLGPKRLPAESFEDYRDRRAAENRCTKIYLKGVFCWKSVRIDKLGMRIGGRGTYIRPKKEQKHE